MKDNGWLRLNRIGNSFYVSQKWTRNMFDLKRMGSKLPYPYLWFGKFG